MKNLWMLAILMLTVGFTSCGGDDVDCNDEAAAEQFIDEQLTAFFAAGLEYAFNPTDPDACNKYKKVIEDYIDAIGDYEKCVPAEDKAEYEADLQDARDELDDLTC